MRRSAELRQLIHCSDAAAWTVNSEHPRECSPNEGFKATTQKFVFRSGSLLSNGVQVGVDSFVCSFRPECAAAEISPSESAFQAHWAAEAIEDAIRG